jgi:hypothetical protein
MAGIFLLVSGTVFAQESGATAPAAEPTAAPAAAPTAEPSPAPVPATPGPMPSKVLKMHQVKAGEDLHLIAAYYYGDARQWKKIWELNKKEIRNPNRIAVDQIIKVEVEPGWQPKFDMDKYLAGRGLGSAVKKGPAKKTTYVREKEEVRSTATPMLLTEPPREETPAGGETEAQPSGPPK